MGSDKPAPDPGMADPGMSEPGMTDPGMADPSGPGMGDGPPDGGDPTLIIPMRVRSGLGGDAALEKALKAAFAGVDWAEFEAAWRQSMSKVN